eukprot:NODE_88_length_21932_cov_0.317867.p11 type:complete len:172 gc:universal NODE_88_length_21932_cov_0.317867:9972-10487(+)
MYPDCTLATEGNSSIDFISISPFLQIKTALMASTYCSHLSSESLFVIYPITTVFGLSLPNPASCTACAIPSTKLLLTKTSANPLMSYSSILVFNSTCNFSFSLLWYTILRSCVIITLSNIVNPLPFLSWLRNDKIMGSELSSVFTVENPIICGLQFLLLGTSYFSNLTRFC